MKKKPTENRNVYIEGTGIDSRQTRELQRSDCNWEERPGVVIPEKDITHFANRSYNWRTQREVFPVIKPELRHLFLEG